LKRLGETLRDEGAIPTTQGRCRCRSHGTRNAPCSDFPSAREVSVSPSWQSGPVRRFLSENLPRPPLKKGLQSKTANSALNWRTRRGFGGGRGRMHLPSL
jgi:hypothetical protein